MTKLVKCGDCDKFIDKKDIVFVLHEFDGNGPFKTQIRNNDKIGVCKKHTDKCSVCNNYWLEDNITECKECGVLLCDFHNSYCNFCDKCICDKCYTVGGHYKKEISCDKCGKQLTIFFDKKYNEHWTLLWCFNCYNYDDLIEDYPEFPNKSCNSCPIPFEKITSLIK